MFFEKGSHFLDSPYGPVITSMSIGQSLEHLIDFGLEALTRFDMLFDESLFEWVELYWMQS